MSILFQQVARIARRGHKLWLSVVDDSLWQRLPNLAPGQALVAMASFTRPLLVNFNPTRCKFRMVEEEEEALSIQTALLHPG